MKIDRLGLSHFRNLVAVELEPGPSFNILWGNNAQGKTNVLEAIHLLGSLKSFRGARNEDLVSRGSPSCRLTGVIEETGVRHLIELTIEGAGKNARVDGKEVRRAGDFFGHLRPILFAPEEVNLVKGSPAGRRALIDRALFQTDWSFLERAREYERCLRQRNRLLREARGESEISPWTEGLVRSGARLRWDRTQYLRRLAPLVGEAYRQVTGGREEAEILYRPAADSLPEQVELLREEIERVASREKRLGQTLAGPHRDDPEFRVEGRPLRIFGSQGEQRSFLLAFKTAQIRDLELLTGSPPVLLLDDMTSELDRRRQDFFFSYLRERPGQVFITTTDCRLFRNQGFSPARFIRVEEGILHHDQFEE